MSAEIRPEETKAALQEVVGLKLLRSRNLCASRLFYFGKPLDPAPIGRRSQFRLGLECPWRILKSGLIFVGSEDYYEESEDTQDPAWEPGMPGGHLQDQRLVELFGELREGDVIITRPGFTVEGAQLDGYGGIRLDLGQDCILEVFPTSAKRMQWIFTPPDGPSFVLMNGVVTRSTKTSQAKTPSEEPGG